MLFDKIIWTSVSPVRKDSTYISLEYVINDLGVFCKGEQRTKDIGFAMSPIGAPLRMTAVNGADYAAKPLGRIAILWDKVTDVQEDPERGTVTVFGNADSKVVMQCEKVNKVEILARIDSMRQFCQPSAQSDAKAAAWLAWTADNEIENPFAPLDELIERERMQIDSRAFSASQLNATVLPSEDIPSKEPPAEEITARFCPNCGHEPSPTAKYCIRCGTKL